MRALLPALARPLAMLRTTGALWLPLRRPGVLTVALEADEALAALQAELVAAPRFRDRLRGRAAALSPARHGGRVARGTRIDTRARARSIPAGAGLSGAGADAVSLPHGADRSALRAARRRGCADRAGPLAEPRAGYSRGHDAIASIRAPAALAPWLACTWQRRDGGGAPRARAARRLHRHRLDAGRRRAGRRPEHDGVPRALDAGVRVVGARMRPGAAPRAARRRRRALRDGGSRWPRSGPTTAGASSSASTRPASDARRAAARGARARGRSARRARTRSCGAAVERPARPGPASSRSRPISASAPASCAAASRRRSATGPSAWRACCACEHALAAARAGEELAPAAFAAGYADQAHFAHECRALAGRAAATALLLSRASVSYKTAAVGSATIARMTMSELQTIPNVGPAVARKLARVDIASVATCADATARSSSSASARSTRCRHDPCLLDTFVAAVDYANGAPARPWWEYSRERKARAACLTRRADAAGLGHRLRRGPAGRAGVLHAGVRPAGRLRRGLGDVRRARHRRHEARVRRPLAGRAELPRRRAPAAAGDDRRRTSRSRSSPTTSTARYERALEAGCAALAEPKDKPQGQRVAYVRDPFGAIGRARHAAVALRHAVARRSERVVASAHWPRERVGQVHFEVGLRGGM